MNECTINLYFHQIRSDKTYEFPRESMNELAKLGLLGLIVPKELGGRGESHVCLSMVMETIARYGGTSLALIYCECIHETNQQIFGVTNKVAFLRPVLLA